VKLTVLVVTTTNWVPTARLAMALVDAGFRVEALCPSRHPIAQAHAASRLHVYQGLRPLRSLVRAIALAKPDLVLPGDDLATSHLHELLRRRALYSADAPGIESLIERSLGAPESFAIVESRAAFMKVAQEEGIRVPRTGITGTDEEVDNWIRADGLPAVLKADGTSGGEGVRIARTATDARRAFRNLKAPPLIARALKRALANQDRTLVWPALLRHRPAVCIQTFVAGHEATSTVACWQGTVLASLHFEVLRKGNAAGHATVVRLIENSEISTAIEKVVRRMNLSGMCGFDFMIEASTGNPYLIEINPRSTQVGHLTLGQGRDLPAALYGAVSGQPIRAAQTVTENDTIALFPHEWARDQHSEFLRTGYHDVPWDAPALVQACIHRSKKQSMWYSRGDAKPETAALVAPVNAPAESSATARNAAL
jgi:hypothetical protein